MPSPRDPEGTRSPLPPQLPTGRLASCLPEPSQQAGRKGGRPGVLELESAATETKTPRVAPQQTQWAEAANMRTGDASSSAQGTERKGSGEREAEPEGLRATITGQRHREPQGRGKNRAERRPKVKARSLCQAHGNISISTHEKLREFQVEQTQRPRP